MAVVEEGMEDILLEDACIFSQALYPHLYLGRARRVGWMGLCLDRSCNAAKRWSSAAGDRHAGGELGIRDQRAFFS